MTHHPMHPHDDVLKRIVEPMPEMQCTGHVRWWDHHAEWFSIWVYFRVAALVFIPNLRNSCGLRSVVKTVRKLVHRAIEVRFLGSGWDQNGAI
jgi:hypothetical protein